MIHKIDGPTSGGNIRSVSTVKRPTKSSGTYGTSFSSHLDETSDVNGLQGVSSAGALGGVLGLQEVDDALAHASKGKLRAEDILDRLDDLRLEILSGAVSKEKLQRLAQIVAQRRGNVTDPKLMAILDEIDLRAQVELAKLGG